MMVMMVIMVVVEAARTNVHIGDKPSALPSKVVAAKCLKGDTGATLRRRLHKME